MTTQTLASSHFIRLHSDTVERWTPLAHHQGRLMNSSTALLRLRLPVPPASQALSAASDRVHRTSSL
jgi:hypothetical protein